MKRKYVDNPEPILYWIEKSLFNTASRIVDVIQGKLFKNKIKLFFPKYVENNIDFTVSTLITI